jgi:nicotinate-nucleotide adenylyltransferase
LKFAIFGGSFDPVHVAHVALARTALDHLALDRLLWVPAGRQWQKPGSHASGEQRAAMIELAIDGEPRFALERCELEREGPSYTIETVLALRARDEADWFLVIGQDQYRGLHTWHRWRDLLPLVTLAVAGREAAPPQPSPEVAAEPHRAVALPLPAMAVSGTEIRARLARGEPVDRLVPPAVARYIDRNHLYRS